MKDIKMKVSVILICSYEKSRISLRLLHNKTTYLCTRNPEILSVSCVSLRLDSYGPGPGVCNRGRSTRAWPFCAAIKVGVAPSLFLAAFRSAFPSIKSRSASASQRLQVSAETGAQEIGEIENNPQGT
jgi:hypothetical protein